MSNQATDQRASNDQGNDDAGDASAALYRNEETMEKDRQQAASLHPGDAVEDRRAAAHGDPDKDPDLENDAPQAPEKPVK